MPKPLALSDAEIAHVMAACRPLAVEQRDAFLLAIAQTLSGLSDHGDGAVYRVCRELQRHFFDPPELPRHAPRWSSRRAMARGRRAMANVAC
jgi:hypothetical protein